MDRSGGHRGRRAEVRDCQWARDRDCLSVTAHDFQLGEEAGPIGWGEELQGRLGALLPARQRLGEQRQAGPAAAAVRQVALAENSDESAVLMEPRGESAGPA